LSIQESQAGERRVDINITLYSMLRWTDCLYPGLSIMLWSLPERSSPQGLGKGSKIATVQEGMYLESSGHQNLKKKVPEESPPPEPPKGSKVLICQGGMYLERSGHQNVKKELPEESPPPKPPKGSKVAICTRRNVSGEFRSPKPEKGAPGKLFPTRVPKRLKSRHLYKGDCMWGVEVTKTWQMSSRRDPPHKGSEKNQE
jgi:hypothetical protein